MAFAPGSTDDIAAAFHQPAVRLGTNIAATAIPNSPGPGKEPYDVVLLFGIIDVLQVCSPALRSAPLGRARTGTG